jgi:hypothetical protein
MPWRGVLKNGMSSHNYIYSPYASSSALGQVMPSEWGTYFMNALLLIPFKIAPSNLKMFWTIVITSCLCYIHTWC